VLTVNCINHESVHYPSPSFATFPASLKLFWPKDLCFYFSFLFSSHKLSEAPCSTLEYLVTLDGHSVATTAFRPLLIHYFHKWKWEVTDHETQFDSMVILNKKNSLTW
jgi:hypothetical protein